MVTAQLKQLALDEPVLTSEYCEGERGGERGERGGERGEREGGEREGVRSERDKEERERLVQAVII